jgi:hypothetical protein
MSFKQTEKNFNSGRLASLDNVEGGEFEEITYNDKMKVECICPKCGRKHIMTFHWIGRGTPRKYCPLCKVSN